jgi:hypothetical protein
VLISIKKKQCQGITALELTDLVGKRYMISFSYVEPKSCMNNYRVVCYESGVANPKIINATKSKKCDNLKSNTNYTVESTVYGLENYNLSKLFFKTTSD